jgi:Subtilase family
MTSRRFAEQLNFIQGSLGELIAVGPTGTGPNDPPCAFQRATLLAGHDDASWLVSSDSPLSPLSPTLEEQYGARTGLARVRLSTARFDARAPIDVLEPDEVLQQAFQLLAERRDRRPLTVSPNHLIGITNGNTCPADEPCPTTAPRSISSATVAPPGHRRPRVLVIDTGLVEDYRQLGLGENTQGCLVEGALRSSETEKGPDGNKYIREYVGHGTFIAGLLTAVAPTAEVYVSNTLPKPGAAFEDVFGNGLFTALKWFQDQIHSETQQDVWPDIISLSAGTPLYYDPQHAPQNHEQGLLSLKNFMDELLQKDTLLVAAAGNNGNSIRFNPAALAAQEAFSSAVVSVGALRERPEDGRACFSDFGSWVKAFAPGERLVSGFSGSADRRLQYQHRTFSECQFLPPSDNSYLCTCQAPVHDGALSYAPPTPLAQGSIADFTTTQNARWSGTSFATPIVAGHIAQRMALSGGDSARQAYAKLLKECDRIEVAGETALKVVPDGYVYQPMFPKQ